jgi:hypothetical protein
VVEGEDKRYASLLRRHRPYPTLSTPIWEQFDKDSRLVLLLQRLLIRSDADLDLPCNSLQGGTRCGTTFAGRAFVCDQMGGFDLTVCPALGQGRQRVVGHRRRHKPCGVQVKELLGDGLLCALLGLDDRRLGALKGRLGRHHQPALGHAIVTELKTLRAGGVIQMVPGVPREGLRDHLRDCTKGVGNPGDKAELLEVGGLVLMVGLRVCDQIPRPGGSLKGRQQRLCPLLADRDIRRVAISAFADKGDATILRDHQCQDRLLQVRPVRSGVAVCLGTEHRKVCLRTQKPWRS